MKNLKTIALSSLLVLSTSLFADNYNYDKKYKNEHKKEYKKEKHHKYKHEEVKKYKELPPGLQKKYKRDGELPPGWEKKYSRGEVLDRNDLRDAKEIRDKRYERIEGTKIYEIHDKIIRVTNATREILEVFK